MLLCFGLLLCYKCLLLFFPNMVADDAVEVAADEVAQHDAEIEDENLGPKDGVEINGNAQIVESVGHTVGKTAHDEERHAKEQREILSLAGESDGGGHNHTAADGQNAAPDRSDGQAAFQNLLCRILKRHGTHAGDDGHNEAADDVAQENKEQLSHFTFFNKAGRSGVEFQSVVHHREQTESKKDGADDALLRQITEAGNSDGHSGIN